MVFLCSFKFEERPEQQRDNADPTWGGYGIEFKIIGSDEFNKSTLTLMGIPQRFVIKRD